MVREVSSAGKESTAHSRRGTDSVGPQIAFLVYSKLQHSWCLPLATTAVGADGGQEIEDFLIPKDLTFEL